MTKAAEINLDALVGPTHNYSGLSFGNVASTQNRSQMSNPREAALQGLNKMKFLSDLGIGQVILPPHERPYLPFLRRLGFSGAPRHIIQKVAKQFPDFLVACSSASSMWAANSATVAPSKDSRDKRVHFTPANLAHHFHRTLETRQTATILKRIFKNGEYFVHHDPLPTHSSFGDEGAANHTRLCGKYDGPGLHIFVYGRAAFAEGKVPKKFPARQTLEASVTIASQHRLRNESFVFVQQNPDAIDAGAFHNDVVSVGDCDLFLVHEQAFLDQSAIRTQIEQKFQKITGTALNWIEVPANRVSMEEAVKSYLFNSQIISAEGKRVLIAPEESFRISAVKTYIEHELIGKGVIDAVHYLDLRQSMQNGGGPACLRLRVVLDTPEQKAFHRAALLNDNLYGSLQKWIEKHYRDRLDRTDLFDPALYQEGCRALDDLTRILKLGPIYDFQKN